ncbi:MAG TPA: SpoIIE family protein phosphatase [Xanthobacteraceae bacterium]|nr:SpoIIE family protein phosphatase [Xanthobacteraceae bacterium]
MLLRTRISLIVGAGFALVAACIGGTAYLHDRVAEARIAEIAISGQTNLWREIVAVRTAGLGNIAEIFVRVPALRQAVARGDREALGRIVDEVSLGLEDGPQAQMIEILGPDRDMLHIANRTVPGMILDAGTLDRAFAGEEVRGLRQAEAGALLLVEARPFELDNGGGRAVLVVARDARLALERFASRVGGSAALVTLRGRLAAVTNEQLWKAAALTLSPRRPVVENVEIDDRTYSVVSVPIRDVTGGTVGALTALKDATESASATRRLRQTAAASALLLSLAGVLGLNLYLWRSFRPLEAALDVLQGLARRDGTAAPEETRRDEIGRVIDAIAAFRSNAQELAETRRQRVRVRLRQEEVIRRELEGLADSIDRDDRDEVLALLGPTEAADRTVADDQLRRLARVMRDLSRRIAEQHAKLSTMVVELRDALVNKTKLIGIQQELEIARQVQRAILPKGVPDDARIGVHGHMTPAQEVGGDFYDYFMIDPDTLGFVIADVSGKGVPAALFMAITRTLLKTTALFERSPSGCVRRLNDLLAAENEQMLFVTLVYGILDLPSGRVTYVNAGHNPPYRVGTGEGDRVTPLPAYGGMAIAVVEGFNYTEQTFTLTPGETLFLYTDGITESFDIDDQPFGNERLVALLEAGAGADARGLTENVLDGVHAFERGAPQADDITCLALRYHGAAAGREEAPTNRLELRVANRLEALAPALEQIEEFCAENGVPMRAIQHVTLALDELATNIISYAWPAGGDHALTLTLTYSSGLLVAELEDDGVPFNPLTLETPDLDASVEDRQVGGLGVHFARTLMDDVRYEHRQARNHSILHKFADKDRARG